MSSPKRARAGARPGGGGPEPVKQLAGGSAAAVAVLDQEPGQPLGAQAGRGFWGRVADQEGQGDLAGDVGEDDGGAGPEGVQARAELVAGRDSLADQVARIVRSIRQLELKKSPSVSETLDWARTLLLLGVEHVDADTAKATINILLKYQSDIAKAVRELEQEQSPVNKAAAAKT